MQILSHDVTVFLLSVGLLIGTAKLFGEIARRFRLPAVVGEIFAGVVLGPTLLGARYPAFYATVFPADGPAFIGLEMLTTLSASLLLFVAGIELDFTSVRRQGMSAVRVALFSAGVSFAIGVAAALLLPGVFHVDFGARPLPLILSLGLAVTITGLPVVAKTLMDLNMTKSDVGTLILSAAMVVDLLGWIFFAIVLAMLRAGTGDVSDTSLQQAGEVASIAAFTIAFTVAALTVGRLLVHETLPLIQKHTSWPGGVIVLMVCIALFSAAATEWMGVHSILGAFIAGVAVGDSSHLRERERDAIEQFVTHVFAPLFIGSIALRVNFLAAFDPVLVVAMLVIAAGGKIAGSYKGARDSGLPVRTSLAVGFAMSAGGTMGIILAQRAYYAGLLAEVHLVAIVTVAVVTSATAGPLIQLALGRRRERRLSDVLSPLAFVPRMTATNGREAVRELAKAASAASGVPEAAIDAAAWGRESVLRSGMPGGLAVPRARIEEIKTPLVAVGLSPRGVDFDSADGSPARLVCMVLTPRNDPSAQIELLDAVVRILGRPDARDAALGAVSFDGLLAVLREAESAAKRG